MSSGWSFPDRPCDFSNKCRHHKAGHCSTQLELGTLAGVIPTEKEQIVSNKDNHLSLPKASRKKTRALPGRFHTFLQAMILGDPRSSIDRGL